MPAGTPVDIESPCRKEKTMAKTATGVMDKPETSTKTKKAATKTAAAKHNTRRRGAGGIKEASAGPRPIPAKSASKPTTKAKSPAKELATRGEEAAARFLYRRGYDVLERNWSCPAGEVDIIAKDEDALVFVEVKTRKNSERGFPSEAVTQKKRERYEKIALAYLEDTHLRDLAVRFDVISLVVIGPDKALIRHHINAFSENAE